VSGPTEPGGRPHPPAWRRPAVVVAIALDVLVAVAALVALALGFSPIVLAFAAILAIAPWASIIDDQERPRRE